MAKFKPKYVRFNYESFSKWPLCIGKIPIPTDEDQDGKVYLATGIDWIGNSYMLRGVVGTCPIDWFDDVE